MAFIGNIDSIFEMFSRTKTLEALYSYMQTANNPNSEIYQRIMRTKGESKINLIDEMVAIEQSYRLKPSCEAFFESHKKYIDFQLIISGEELFASLLLRNALSRLLMITLEILSSINRHILAQACILRQEC